MPPPAYPRECGPSAPLLPQSTAAPRRPGVTLGRPPAPGLAIATARTPFEAPRPAACLAVLALASALLLPGLGAPDLCAPDEPRYAQVAEQVRAGADGRVLHLGDERYAQKPPLYFWLAALAGAPEGRVSERAARLPSALAGIATALLTLALGSAL